MASVTPDQAADHFGKLAVFAQADMPGSSERTRQRLGRQPNGPGLLADIDRAAYYHR